MQHYCFIFNEKKNINTVFWLSVLWLKFTFLIEV